MNPDARRKFIGGSDLAAVLGISPWRTALQLWQDKIRPPAPETDPARLKLLNRGKRLEPYILDMIRQEHGACIVASNERYQDESVPFFACEIDAEAQDAERGHINLELKTVHPFKVREWGAELTDDLPLHYIAQVQWGLGITRREHCDVYALIGDDLRRYAVQADAELIGVLREKALHFWRFHVETGIPPDPVNDADLQSLYPTDRGASVEADPQVADAIADLHELRGQAKAIAERIEERETFVKRAMGDAALLTLGGKTAASWKTQKARRFGQRAFKAAHPELFEQFIETGEQRVFRLA